MEIAYKMTAQDWIAAYRIGTAHLRIASFIGVILLVAVAVVVMGVAVVGNGIAQYWQRQGGAFPWHLLRFAVTGPAVFLVIAPLALWSVSARRVILDGQSVTTHVRGGKTPRYWRDVKLVLNEWDCVAICSGTLDALVIPRRAFPCRAEADAFYQAALDFWHEANGILPPPAPDVSGVWPPAPRPTNSAEPGDGPEC